jgi:hypothetical protein
MREWGIVNLDTGVENAARDHKALLAVAAGDKPEQAKAFKALDHSLDALSRDVAEQAFQGERSKRKQWAEIQKEIADLLEAGRALLEEAEAPEGNRAEKIERRYQRMQSRVTKLVG